MALGPSPADTVTAWLRWSRNSPAPRPSPTVTHQHASTVTAATDTHDWTRRRRPTRRGPAAFGPAPARLFPRSARAVLPSGRYGTRVRAGDDDEDDVEKSKRVGLGGRSSVRCRYRGSAVPCLNLNRPMLRRYCLCCCCCWLLPAPSSSSASRGAAPGWPLDDNRPRLASLRCRSPAARTAPSGRSAAAQLAAKLRRKRLLLSAAVPRRLCGRHCAVRIRFSPHSQSPSTLARTSATRTSKSVRHGRVETEKAVGGRRGRRTGGRTDGAR